MALWTALALFAIFSVNVAMGSLSGSTFLSDVGEMLLLLAASIAFVVAILGKEAAARNTKG